MNLVELTKHTQPEAAAEDYLRKMGILQTFTECPYCKGQRVGKIRRGLFKCYHCRNEWSRRRGSRLFGFPITFTRSNLFLDFPGDYGFNRSELANYSDRNFFGEIVRTCFFKNFERSLHKYYRLYDPADHEW